MFRVLKRDNKIVDFDIKKISNAIAQAFEACERQTNDNIIDFLALKVTSDFESKIKDEIIQVEELSLYLIQFLRERYPVQLRERYGLPEEELTPEQTLALIGEIRSCKKQGDEVDLEKAAAIVMEDFRSGKMGRITLELPQ